MPISVLIAIGLIGLILMLQGRKREEAAQSTPLDSDASTLDQLARAGSDLTRPHTIEFFLYLPDRAAAEAVAADLQREDFRTEVSQEEESDWLCLARRVMVPDMAGLRSCRERLTTLAEAHQGVYDGWGTEVEDG